MAKNVSKAVGTLLAAAALAAGFSSSASAANQVDCGNRTDFASITTFNGPKYCFANGGSLNVNIPEIEIINSGNNRVVAYFTDGASVNLSWKYATYKAHRSMTINRITIY